MPNQVAACFVVFDDVDSFDLLLVFLEVDDTGVAEDPIHMDLKQNPFNQYTEVFSTGEAVSKCRPSIVSICSMVTCASHSESLAIKRNTSKLSGRPTRRISFTVDVASLPGCSLRFAVFTRGKVMAADARYDILKLCSRIDVFSSVRLEDGVVHSHSPRCNPIPPSLPPSSRNSSSAPLPPIPGSCSPNGIRALEGQMIPPPVFSEARYSTHTGCDTGLSTANSRYDTPIHA